ncbi:MAG: hypothetical protein OHK0021_13260 [Bryobacter sp.]
MSKKRSVARLLEDLRFFLDRSLGVSPIREALESENLRVEIHDDHFAKDEKDEVWLAEVARRDWVILTKDQRFRYRPLEKASLENSGARVFVLTAGKLRGEDIAAIFVHAVPAMLQRIRDTPKPFLAYVSRNGRVRVEKLQ